MGGAKHQEPRSCFAIVCIHSAPPHDPLPEVSTPDCGALLDAHSEAAIGGGVSWLRRMQVSDDKAILLS